MNGKEERGKRKDTGRKSLKEQEYGECWGQPEAELKTKTVTQCLPLLAILGIM